MSDKPKIPKYDPDNPDAFDEKAWLKAYISQLDIEQMKKDYSEYKKDDYVPMEDLLDELDTINERINKDSA